MSAGKGKWEVIFFVTLAIVGFSFVGYLLINNQTGEKKDIELAAKLKQSEELNATVIMLVEVAYTNDTTRFNDYQKGILKAVVANDIPKALHEMAPHHHKFVKN